MQSTSYTQTVDGTAKQKELGDQLESIGKSSRETLASIRESQQQVEVIWTKIQENNYTIEKTGIHVNISSEHYKQLRSLYEDTKIMLHNEEQQLKPQDETKVNLNFDDRNQKMSQEQKMRLKRQFKIIQLQQTVKQRKEEPSQKIKVMYEILLDNLTYNGQ